MPAASNTMCVKNIKIKNFKTFKSLDLDLDDFNVVIGANASGKSNFISIFKFLHDIVSHGLDNAVSLQGGIELMHNFKIGSKPNIVFEIHTSFKDHPIRFPYGDDNIDFMLCSDMTYHFELGMKNNSFTVEHDWMKLSGSTDVANSNICAAITIKHVDNDVDISFDPPIPDKSDYTFMRHLSDITKNSLILEPNVGPPFLSKILMIMSNSMHIYDLNSRLIKEPSSVINKAELESDGSNLSVVLKNMEKSSEHQKSFLNVVKDILPFVKSATAQKYLDKTVLLNILETYYPQSIPSSSASDGTVNIIALIVALYFQKNKLTILEEPERNVHPHLIINIVDMMKDASKRGQVIATTHNPELVRHTGAENLLLVQRDSEGFSNIIKPSSISEVQEFLSHKMAITDLYVQNLLE